MGGLPGRPNPLSWVGAKVQEVRLRKERHAGLLWGRLTWGQAGPGLGNSFTGQSTPAQLPVATDLGSGCTPTTQATLFPGTSLECPATLSVCCWE